MTMVLELCLADLAGSRFAASPLSETVRAVLLLSGPGRAPVNVELRPDGIVLMPSVFNWPLVSTGLATSSQTGLIYPARGVATVWRVLSGQRASQLAATEELIGVTRARFIEILI